MANQKISALNSATTTDGTEVLPVVQSAETKKMAVSVIKDYLLSVAGTFTNKTITGGTVNPTTLQEGGVAAVIQTDIGTAPNEIPLNQYLGSMAYQNLEDVIIGNLTVTGTAVFRQEVQTGSFSWNDALSSPDAVAGRKQVVTGIHDKMSRCLLKDDGTVNYYLDPLDSTKKADGSAAVLTGADGMVMVEIPRFYVRRTVAGTVTTWSISAIPQSGYTVHPAFVKAGVEVPYRYYGAYDACYWDATDSTYKSGLNLDDLTSSLDLVADKLASVSGVYPIVGVTRAECRSLAANRGTGWHQLDFALWSAVQLLYLVEYQSFYSQNILGAGNTNGSYLASSSNQNDSPHTIAGASNARGNGSTNTTTGAGVSAKPGTSYMSYRGIENFFGNCWNWADGINVNVTANGNVHITNDYRNFADDTATGHTLVTSSASTGANYVSAIAAIDNYFIATSVSGGSATTYLTDYWYGSTSSNRVVYVGGHAVIAALAGAFAVNADNAASASNRTISARLAY